MKTKTISLETAKALAKVCKEREVWLPEAYWKYCKGRAREDLLWPTNKLYEGLNSEQMNWERDNSVNTYDTNELLEILKTYIFEITWATRGWEAVYLISHKAGVREIKTCFDPIPQEALAKLLIYLIENNFYHDN